MSLLLDSHTLLWLMQSNPSLSEKAVSLIADPSNLLYLSMASVWEIGFQTPIVWLPSQNTTAGMHSDRMNPFAPDRLFSHPRNRKRENETAIHFETHLRKPESCYQRTARESFEWLCPINFSRLSSSYSFIQHSFMPTIQCESLADVYVPITFREMSRDDPMNYRKRFVCIPP